MISLKEMTCHFSVALTSLVQIKQNTGAKTVEINRNIVGTLLAYSAKNEKVTYFEKALKYPLCSVPLSLANPDGSCRATTNSRLLEVIVKKCDSPLQHPRESPPAKDSVGACIIDFIAIIRTMTKIPETYETFTWKFLRTFVFIKICRMEQVCLFK